MTQTLRPASLLDQLLGACWGVTLNRTAAGGVAVTIRKVEVRDAVPPTAPEDCNRQDWAIHREREDAEQAIEAVWQAARLVQT